MEGGVIPGIDEATEFVRSHISTTRLQDPVLAIICGSGLGGLANVLMAEPTMSLSYRDIPYCAQSTVPGHVGKLVFGLLEAQSRPVVLMLGRLHYYEGHSMQAITFPIRLLRRLGVSTLLLTNAAGGLNSEYSVGDIVLLNDHINLAGLGGNHPLRGPNPGDFGVRFPALSDAYDLSLRRRAHAVWSRVYQAPGNGRRLHEGVYAFACGPSYETRAECRLLAKLGADIVGMSTVPEVIVARHCGMKVLALSLVTNQAVLDATLRGDDCNLQECALEDLAKATAKGKASHDEVLAAAHSAQADMQARLLLLLS